MEFYTTSYKGLYLWIIEVSRFCEVTKNQVMNYLWKIIIQKWKCVRTSLVGPKRKSESCSVVYNSLWPHGLCRLWKSPGQDTWEGSCSLLQGIFPIHGLDPGLPHCRQILYQLSYHGGTGICSNHNDCILDNFPFQLAQWNFNRVATMKPEKQT